MAALRSPRGCPWDREQSHSSLREHAVEEVYELMDAIEAGDDAEMAEELGDLLLQVIFHCQLGSERGAFDFTTVTRHLNKKLIRRHPHVFADTQVHSVDQVWANWEKIKRDEKKGSSHERRSALDGVPRHLPALLRSQKIVKKAQKAALSTPQISRPVTSKQQIAKQLFDIAAMCQGQGWSAEQLLREETKRREKLWRREESLRAASKTPEKHPAK